MTRIKPAPLLAQLAIIVKFFMYDSSVICFVLSRVFNMSLWLERLSNHFLHCTSSTLNKLSYSNDLSYIVRGESRTGLHCSLPKERVTILDLLFFMINVIF